MAPGFPYACDAPLGDAPTEALPAVAAPPVRCRRGGVDGAIGHVKPACAAARPEIFDLVLRRLHADVVVDAVGPVHPEVRRHRAVAAERDQHVAGDVALRQAQLRGLDAIHIQADLRLVDHLVDVHVGRAGNARDLAGELLGDFVVGRRIAARPPADRWARAARSSKSGW